MKGRDVVIWDGARVERTYLGGVETRSSVLCVLGSKHLLDIQLGI